MTGQKMDKWRKTSGQRTKGALGLAKDVANDPDVKKGYGGLAGRLIR
jgi:hypothetical protein